MEGNNRIFNNKKLSGTCTFRCVNNIVVLWTEQERANARPDTGRRTTNERSSKELDLLAFSV